MFSKNNCTITFVRKTPPTFTPISFEADISDFKDDPISRNITYKKLVGGIIVSGIEKVISKKISFDFIVENFEVIKLLQPSATDTVSDFDSQDKWKIALQFSSDEGVNSIIFYDAMIDSFNYSFDDDLLICNISFSLPLKNINGDNSIYLNNISSITEKDDIMGYE